MRLKVKFLDKDLCESMRFLKADVEYVWRFQEIVKFI